MTKAIKINESFFYIEGDDLNTKKEICKLLTIVDEASKFKPKFSQYGMKADVHEFFRIHEGKIIIPMGMLPFLSKFGVFLPHEEPEFSDEFIQDYFDRTVENVLPFKPFEHQSNIFFDCIKNKRQLAIACTGAGKSLALGLITDFLFKQNKKILIIVPSISLVTQLYGDFLDYNLTELYNEIHLIGGENNIKHLDKLVTISTWQSLQKMDKAIFKTLDAILVDEVHGAKVGTKTLDIVLSAINAKYRIGMTGTLPEQPQDKMSIFSIVGNPKIFMKTSGLIKLGLATPVKINTIKLEYSHQDTREFKENKTFPEQLGFIKEHQNRSLFIAKVSLSAATKHGNTVIMYTHIAHGQELFRTLMQERYPDIIVEQKDIVGKKAFQFQQQHRIYFINGATESSQREEIKKILEINEDAILVAGYSLFSTGINIRKLSNIVFASPLKSFTTVLQSVGRAIRVHTSKDAANIYDFVDLLPVFRKQAEKRLAFYKHEDFEINERTVRI
jgi:superfamily II DNA or RNA helicase